MRAMGPLLAFTVACGPSLDASSEPGEDRGLAAVRAQVTPTAEFPYRVTFSPVSLRRPFSITWNQNGRSHEVSQTWIGSGTVTTVAPPGVDPRRSVTLICSDHLGRPRLFSVSFPVPKPHWPADRTVRARSGGWTARIGLSFDQPQLVLAGPPLAPGRSRAFSLRTIGRFDPTPRNPRGLRGYWFGDRNGLTSNVDRGLHRSGSLVRVVGEMAEGPTADFTAMFRMDDAKGSRPRLSAFGHEITVRRNLARSLQANMGSVPVEVGRPKGKDFLVFVREDPIPSSALDGPWPGAGGAAKVIARDHRGIPTAATVRLTAMKIVRRTPVEFFVRMP